MDGLTIIEALRRGTRTPVLVLSALGASTTGRGLRAGGDDYLTKPFARLNSSPDRGLLRRPAENLICAAGGTA
jgi:two-component system OmpR family response regulator